MMDSSKVLEIFKEITRIPRESGHEEAMRAYLQKFAKERNLACKTDEVGNVCITKEASKGKENVPTLVLQGHQDMVCEKRSGVTHDFSKDPIKYEIEDGWMVAKDTTLGADDGIGDAAMLALLDSDLPMGKIECVFTVSEETGMDGAFGMQPGFFTGKTMINVDSEDEGQLFIGCAGGVDTLAHFKYQAVNFNKSYKTLHLHIFNGLGGHSGDDINKGRMNTLSTLAKFLSKELENEEFQLIVLKGGGKPNAIAREAEAVIAAVDVKGVEDRFFKFMEEAVKEYAETDPDIKYTAAGCQCTEKPMDSKDADALVRALAACPHGVIAMSKDVPGLVETSTNLASISMHQMGEVEVVTSQRSSDKAELKEIAEKVAEVFRKAGAEVEHVSEYPGWKPNTKSHILDVCVSSYKKLFGKEPEIKAIHAGLECGLFGEKFGNLDMISFGPTLRNVHTPGERLDLDSLDKFVKHLTDVVTSFS